MSGGCWPIVAYTAFSGAALLRHEPRSCMMLRRRDDWIGFSERRRPGGPSWLVQETLTIRAVIPIPMYLASSFSQRRT